jgi:coenzyme F420 biosynthesis associated uncharacterized protein
VQLVDWSVAEATGVRLVPPGPKLSLTEASATVEDLRRLADEAAGHVERYTGLDSGQTSAQIVVVDRPDWVRANVAGFRRLAEPLLQRVVERRTGEASSGLGAALGNLGLSNLGGLGGLSAPMAAVGAKAAGAEVGVLLAYLGTRVLGQFELLGPLPEDGAAGPGRLSLVAPNIVSTERTLQVDPHDFRLWVCLHEVTHRTQFAAAPWLHDHVQTLLGDYLDAADLDPAALFGRLRSALVGMAKVAAGRSDASLVELMQTPAQRDILDRLTGLMSLLEGHADVVMDGVGPEVVASVGSIRSRFEGRRNDINPLDKAVRRLLGVEAKMKQYAEGAAFVRHVLDRLGMAGVNRIWQGPELLPTVAEIRDPDRWLQRVGEAPAISA